MIRKKNSFFTFIFSFIPGAGEMYMGFMKRGVSTMSLFFFLVFSATWLELSPLLFILPVVWFYSFFSVHNLRSMPDDEFYAQEDNFILNFELTRSNLSSISKKYNLAFASVLIIIGFTILWNNLYRMVRWSIPEPFRSYMFNLGRYFPQLIVGIGIIFFGVYLIRGKKKELDYQLLEDKGGNQYENS